MTLARYFLMPVTMPIGLPRLCLVLLLLAVVSFPVIPARAERGGEGGKPDASRNKPPVAGKSAVSDKAIATDQQGSDDASSPSSVQGRSPFGREFHPRRLAGPLEKLETQLAEARRAFAADPDDPDKLIWLGRRLGYVWRMQEAIEVYTRGIKRWPDNAALYRHRGHRYISVREFDKALVDLMHAAELIRDKPDVIEQDGMPNDRNIPLTTLGFNIYYHLGVAHYATGDYHASVLAFKQAMVFGRKHADNVVACIDWSYLANLQIGRPLRAEKLLSVINPEMEIIENHAYFQRLLVYKGVRTFEEVWGKTDDELQRLTLGYGLSRWLLEQSREDEAKKILRTLIASEYWPAFGVVAAEAEWYNRKGTWGEP